MSIHQKFTPFNQLKYDFPASIVVFLVALPLCLGIALASGAEAFSGIIAGVVGGIVVTVFSGSHLGVSGPAAGLAVIVFTAIQDFGAFDIFLFAVVIGGVIQLALGFIQAGIIGYFFPSSVIKGMLSGIGIIIFLKQIPHALGYDEDYEGDLDFVQPDGQNTFSELLNSADYLSPGVMLISAVSLAILIFWESPYMKKAKLSGIIQGPLVAVISGILMVMWFENFPSLKIDSRHIVDVPVAGSISDFFGQFSFPDFSQWSNPQVYITGITIAVVASLESLLCVEATDKLDPYKRVTPTNRELKAQGIGNIISGLIGGLPITQVIVRSSANIQSGGRTKASAFIHGILLLISAMSIPNLLNMIPLGCLAAILLVVGYKLAKPALFVTMYKSGMNQFLPFICTIIGIIFTDLLIGIGIGMAVGIFYILQGNMQNPYIFNLADHKIGDPILIKLAEQISFLNKVSILNALEMIPENSHVIIDASNSLKIHPDVIEIIHDFESRAEVKNIRVEILDLKENYQDAFGQLNETVEKIHRHNQKAE